jgi:nucleoid DNA-binding protein
MSVSIRFYLFAADGPQRISQRVMEGLCHGQDAMPQFANTKQRVADVVVELENGKPARILQANGSFLDFDDKGKVHESLVRGGFGAIETHTALERSKRTGPSKIVDLSPKLNREKWERERKWELSKQQLDVIADDIWKRKLAATAKVMQAKGAAPRPVPLTHEAKEAIREVATQLYGIDLTLQQLSEVALKGFIFEIEARAAREGNEPLWLGLAASADRRREIKARHRTGKGSWYAQVDVTSWDEACNTGQIILSKEEKCASKKEAEKAAQRLLAEHAKYFSATHSVDASVFCDLEWTGDKQEERE